MKGYTGKFKQRISNNELLIFGGIMDSRSGAAVEMFHECGYDALLIDREHTALNSETILEHIRLARALELPCMVRAADATYHEICRTLDQGPDGIFVPRIRSREEVENIVRTIKYPPFGIRGLGGSTCPAGKYIGWAHVKDQIAYGNSGIVIGIQIETAEALANLDSILSVPGIDLAIVGNDDLSIGMGIPGQWEGQKYIQAVESIISACSRNKVMPGIACGDPARVRFWMDRGMRAFWYSADIVLMWQAARQGMDALKESLSR